MVAIIMNSIAILMTMFLTFIAIPQRRWRIVGYLSFLSLTEFVSLLTISILIHR